MHPDLEKLLTEKRINKVQAGQLDRVAPGKYCSHKAWGAGKITAWNFLTKRVTIDFEAKPGHEMGLEFALKNLESLPAEHFRAQRLEQIDSLRKLAKTDPVELVRVTLEGHGNSIRQEDLQSSLQGTVIEGGETEYKKWWDSTRAKLKENTAFVLPTKKGELIRLRGEQLSAGQAIVVDYLDAKDAKARVKVLETLSVSSLKADSENAKKLLDEIEIDVSRNSKLAQTLQYALELAVLRDEILAAVPAEVHPEDVIPLEKLLTSEHKKLRDVMGGMPGTRQKKIYEKYLSAFGERWIIETLLIFDFSGARAVVEVAKFIIEKGREETLIEHIRKGISRHTLSTDGLIWVCRERAKASKPAFSVAIGSALLAHFERDHSEDGPSRVQRLRNLLMEDKELVPDVLKGAEYNEVRQFSKKLLASPAFSDLDRKSLMARVIKHHPAALELVAGSDQRDSQQEQQIVVSAQSLQRKKDELSDLIKNRIPQNTKDISIARSYGDLRENFEYKAAKEMQAVLMRRKDELDRDIDMARVSDFKKPDTNVVSIGTVVDLELETSKKKITYTVLGAWDSDPEKSILSYLSEMGQALLGFKAGDSVELKQDEKITKCLVKSIKAYVG